MWAHGADLRLFLQRCGIKVDGHGKTKKSVTGGVSPRHAEVSPGQNAKRVPGRSGYSSGGDEMDHERVEYS